MITKADAIKAVNDQLRSSNLDPAIYHVRHVEEYDWGWVIDWIPKEPAHALYGASVYLVHKAGVMSTYNEVAMKENTNKMYGDNVIDAFVHRVRQQMNSQR